MIPEGLIPKEYVRKQRILKSKLLLLAISVLQAFVTSQP